MIHIVTPRFTKSPSLVLIGLIFTEIEAFKNKKNLQRNVLKSGQIHTFSMMKTSQPQKKVRQLYVLFPYIFHTFHVTLLVNPINNRQFHLFHLIKGKSSMLSPNRCYGLQPLMTALVFTGKFLSAKKGSFFSVVKKEQMPDPCYLILGFVTSIHFTPS